jgi:hypothetical protein
MKKSILNLSLLLILIFGYSVNNHAQIEQSNKLTLVSQLQSYNNLVNLGNGWLEITEFVIIANITPEQAREKAIRKACQMAIEQFAGIEVTGRISLIQVESNNEITMDHFSKLTNQVSNGIILEKEILEEENITENNLLYKRVTVKLKVGKQQGESDPYFSLDASLNKTYFKEDEELFLSVIPSKDCYLTILNIMSDENVVTIFPNQYREDNFVKAGDVFELPNKSDIKQGIMFKVNLLPERLEDSEIIKIIATKEPVSIKINSDFNTAFEALQNWLITIPRDQIEEVDLQYFIYR